VAFRGENFKLLLRIPLDVKILVCGNALVKEDSLPLRLLPLLKKEFPDIGFKEFDAVEELEDEGEDLLILDTVVGIKRVKVFEDIDSFSDSPRFSLHDFDLLSYLKLLKKVGKVRKVRIIGIPSIEIRRTKKDIVRIVKEVCDTKSREYKQL